MKEYREHRRTYDDRCRVKFGIGINDLIRIVDKSPEQKKLLKDYHNYSPLFNSKSTMNVLCKYIDNMDFDYKYRKDKSAFDYHNFMSINESQLDKSILKSVNKVITRYNRIYKQRSINIKYVAMNLGEDDSKELKSRMFDDIFEDFTSEIVSICGGAVNAVNYMVYCLYNINKTAQMSFLWYCFGEQIVENVKKNSTHRYKLVENESGSEFFGKRFSIVDEWDGDEKDGNI